MIKGSSSSRIHQTDESMGSKIGYLKHISIGRKGKMHEDEEACKDLEIA